MQKTLAEHWAEWETLILNPINAGPVQRKETKRAFYAGAQAMFSAATAGVEPGDGPPTEEDMAHVERLNQELQDFAAAVTAGRA